MSTTTSIFIVVLCICIGVVIGALLSRRRGAAPAPILPAPDAAPAEAPPEPALVPPAGIQSAPALPGDQPVLTVWRSAGDRLWLEMDGQRLEARSALSSDQSRRLLMTVMELRPWLDIPAEPAPVQKPAPAAVPPPVVLEAAAENTVKPVPVIQTLLGINKPASAEQRPDSPLMKSMLEQIDDVLQVKLAASIYRQREIHLVDGPGGTVIVKEGLLQYEGIGAVPDPELQALIRLAVSDWERGVR